VQFLRDFKNTEIDSNDLQEKRTGSADIVYRSADVVCRYSEPAYEEFQHLFVYWKCTKESLSDHVTVEETRDRCQSRDKVIKRCIYTKCYLWIDCACPQNTP
jgi:hypothetical protein